MKTLYRDNCYGMDLTTDPGISSLRKSLTTIRLGCPTLPAVRTFTKLSYLPSCRSRMITGLSDDVIVDIQYEGGRKAFTYQAFNSNRILRDPDPLSEVVCPDVLCDVSMTQTYPRSSLRAPFVWIDDASITESCQTSQVEHDPDKQWNHG